MNYVMSDIHGCYGEFKEMLNLINFKDEDKLYILGDAVDRGPNSVKLIRYIMEKPNIHLIMGNHEEMIRRTYDPMELEWKYFNSMWRANGGISTAMELISLSCRLSSKIDHFLRIKLITKHFQFLGLSK